MITQGQAYTAATLQGFNPKPPVRVAIGDFVLLQGLPFAGGVQIASGDRVLVLGGPLPYQRGIFVAALGPWARSGDDLTNAFVWALEGLNAGGWTLPSSAPVTPGTSPQIWAPLQVSPTVAVDISGGTVNQGAPGAAPWPTSIFRGTAPVDSDNPLPVTVQSVSGTAPLPAGAATSALQTTGNASLVSILSALGALATQATLAAINALLGTIFTRLADGSQETQIVGTLPLPTGAATSALQTSGNASLSSIATAVGGTLAVSAAALPLPAGAATSANQGTGNSSLAAIAASVAGTLLVDGSAHTQPVSAAALPLPAGASTAALQTSGNASLTAIASSLAGTIAVDASGHTVPISASALPLPTGATTAANQSTANTSLAAIATNTAAGATQTTLASILARFWAALGQTTMAASAPVVIASDQSPVPTLVSDLSTTGNLTANGQSVTLNVPSMGTAWINVAGTWTGTLVARGSLDGVVFFTLQGRLPNAGAQTSTFTTNNTLRFAVAGLQSVQLNAQAAMTGTANVTIRAGAGSTGVTLIESTPSGTATIGAFTGTGTASTPAGGTLSTIVANATTGSVALGVLNAAATLNLNGQCSAAFNLAAGTLIGTLVAEYAYATSPNLWYLTSFRDPSTTAEYASIVFGSSNTEQGYELVVPGGAVTARVRVSAYTSGTANVNLQGLQSARSVVQMRIQDSNRATYSAGIVGLAPAAAATDIFTIAGSATKVIRLIDITIDGTAGTAIATAAQLLKRSAADTAGTSTAPTIVPHDSLDAAGTAVVAAYTVNPSLGALVGLLDVADVSLPLATGSPGRVTFVFDTKGKAGVLRGAAQQIALNLNGATVVSGSLNIRARWTEE